MNHPVTRLISCLVFLAPIGIEKMMAQSSDNKTVEAAKPAAGTQVAQSVKKSVPVELDYLLYLPEGYDEKETWPLMLFLHGAGERGDDLEKVMVHGPPKLAKHKKFPFIVVSPQCPDDKWWEPVSLTALLDEVCEKYKVDEDRVYVTGLSMGGFGTWSLVVYSADRFAAVAPICGGGIPFVTARRAGKLPIWAFHGSADNVVPAKYSEEIVAALKKSGNDARLTIYDGVGHDSWTRTYDNPELYEWLLSHKRKSPEE